MYGEDLGGANWSHKPGWTPEGVRRKGLIAVKMWHAVAAVVIVSLVASGAALAEPTLNGFTGLLTTPTADTLENGRYNVGINSSELEDWDNFGYYANFGLGEETEAGVLMFRSDENGGGSQIDSASLRRDQDETFLSIKRNLTDPEEGGPNIAAGIFDITDEVETTVYMVATWQQGRVVGEVEGKEVRFLDLHAGFAAGIFEDFFTGVNLRFGPDVEIMGEWIMDEINLGARFSPAPNFTIDAGFLDVDDLAVNVSYSSDL